MRGSGRRKIKTRKFVEACLARGMTSPSLIQAELEKRGKTVSDNAITMMIKRLGVDRKAIEETVKLERKKDILEFQRVKDYLTLASSTGVTKKQQDKQLTNLHRVWEWMGKTTPETWSYQSLLDMLKQHYRSIEDERGRIAFEHPHAVADYLSAVSTIFPTIIPKGWSAGFTREAGELKDYFAFQEFDDLIYALTDTPQMSREGWEAAYKTQVNAGCREGAKLNTGLLSLRWENINYDTRRCSIRDKGGKGKAARLWRNVPLDLFPWLHGFDALKAYHSRLYGYEPTNKQHATGRVFRINYDNYLDQFHRTRKACNGRIAGDLETMKPHVIRKTHAQWLIKLRVPLERICGQFPDGRFGVGWDNPLNLLKYYVTLEEDEEIEIMQTAHKRMVALGLVAPLVAWEKDSLGDDYAFLPRIEESNIPLLIQR